MRMVHCLVLLYRHSVLVLGVWLSLLRMQVPMRASRRSPAIEVAATLSTDDVQSVVPAEKRRHLRYAVDGEGTRLYTASTAAEKYSVCTDWRRGGSAHRAGRAKPWPEIRSRRVAAQRSSA